MFWLPGVVHIILSLSFSENAKISQDGLVNFFKFGTGGNPRTSAPYNFAGPGCSQGAYESNCGILKPQPDSMPVGEPKLSNIFGTLSMSTSVEL